MPRVRTPRRIDFWEINGRAIYETAFTVSLGIFVVFSLGLVAGGESISVTLLTSFVVAIQSATGFLIVLMLFPGSAQNNSLLVAFGMAVGSTVFIFTNLTAVNLGIAGLWVPIAILGLVSLLAQWRYRVLPDGTLRRSRLTAFRWKKAVATRVFSFLPAYLYLLAAWRSWPVQGDSWWQINTDAPTYEGASISAGIFGPTTNLAVKDYGLNYNWLSNAWSGQLTDLTDAAPYYSSTRSLYLWSLIVVGAVAWTIGKRFGRSQITPFFAVVVATASTVIPARLDHAIPILFDYPGPSVQFSLASFTVLFLAIWIAIEKGVSKGLFSVIVLLSFASVGSRIFLFWNLGVLLMALIAFVYIRRNDAKRNLWGIVVACFLGTVVAVFSILLVPSYGSFQLENILGLVTPNFQIADLYSLTPLWSEIGKPLFVISFIAMLLVSSAGALWFWLTKKPRTIGTIAVLVSANFVAGIYGAFSMDYIISANISALYSGLIPMLIFSGIGAGLIIEGRKADAKTDRKAFSKWLAIQLVVGLILGLTLLWTWQHVYGFRFDAVIRWGVPVALLLLLFFGVKRGLPTLVKPQPELTLLLVIAAIATPLWTSLWFQTRSPVATDPQQGYAINQDMINAGRWVQKNTDQSSIFSTNRFCTRADDTGPKCFSPVQSVTVFAHRQALLEGFSYGPLQGIYDDSGLYESMTNRVMNSVDFAVNPSFRSCAYLAEQGVNYFWLDKTVSHSAQLTRLFSPIFSNETIAILNLKECTAFSPLQS